jgi:uncharacterized DUF497 family protein
VALSVLADGVFPRIYFAIRSKHLAAHGVMPAEFEQVLNNEPLDMDFESIDNEERYRAVGPTSGGRLLSVVFTVRDGRLRAVTAFPASAADKKAFLERTR